MKKMITCGLLIAIFMLSTLVAPAQEQTIYKPKWASDKGYWVVEGNVKTPLNHIVRFYNNNDVLIYAENIEGVKLNTNKRKVKMKLKRALESALLAFENKEQNMEGLALVKSTL
ncbi:hypothetical protein LZZ85_02165 [Terrimonas sp. NA20]|uniref:Uncharacterized protein n=1 Tax=Terrimonas ginsenosidimutans TaxID=2908004 RepID=A0ABS9KL54_9BACT|nr:hypothetical protein [Terrimonas ginsenosidimutans]MCG2613058.1 hypothetical protein [Terrimonas ginsenosidimutans]